MSARALGVLLALALATPAGAQERGYRLERAAFADLPGFAQDRHDEALAAFRASCHAPVHAPTALPELSAAALLRACAAATRPAAGAHSRAFFEKNFLPWRIAPNEAPDAFFTGYYQPEFPGALVRNVDFPTPVYALPPPDILADKPERAAIEDGALDGKPGVKILVYLRDKADLFLAQVQGSARVRLTNGSILRLSFAGRNGQPYTGLARVLVQRGVAPPEQMTMPRLIEWMRRNGLGKGQAGDDLLRLNKSFVFFAGAIDRSPAQQPQGAGGAALTPFRSIAIDSHVWPYGLPFFIDAALPWKGAAPEPFQRLVVAQDTGSAIVGPARADVYFGLGDAAGQRAGEARHHGQLYLLLPRE
jgi:membrane-bound lytic murein transglycosylase A